MLFDFATKVTQHSLQIRRQRVAQFYAGMSVSIFPLKSGSLSSGTGGSHCSGISGSIYSGMGGSV